MVVKGAFFISSLYEGTFSFSQKLNIRQHNNTSRRWSDAEGSPRPPVQDRCLHQMKAIRCIAVRPIQKRLWQAVSQ